MIVAGLQVLDCLCATTGSSLHRARRVVDGTPVLIKLLHRANVNDEQSARFRQEFALFQTLAAPGIARPVSLIEEGDYLAMELEYFEGESLVTILDRERPDVPTCLRLACQLAQALGALHASRLTHYDLRPANMLANLESGKLCLIDLNMASRGLQDASTSPNGDVSGGDFVYMSPEQTGRMNRAVDYRTDFYTFGVLLYRILTGSLPFQATTPLEWVHCHIARKPSPPWQLLSGIPGLVSDLVMKLLEKEAEDRYQSSHGLQYDLEQCLALVTSASPPARIQLGSRDVSDRFQLPQKLYGREVELTALRDAFDRVRRANQPELILVSGSAGVGKSALVRELHKSIVDADGYFISGKFDQFKRNIPYATIAQAFSSLIQQILTESEERIAEWQQQLRSALGDNAQLIIDVIPQLELIIGPQHAVPELPLAEAQIRFQLAFQAFVCVSATSAHPIALFLDDLQWLDTASLNLVTHLLAHASNSNLLVIGAYRENEVDSKHPLMCTVRDARERGMHVEQIWLAPLYPVHLNRLVADVLHAEPARVKPLVEVVMEKTEGNPFFFLQFLSMLHAEGLITFDHGQSRWSWDLPGIQSKRFTDNVVELMLGKLRSLPATSQYALKLAACLGSAPEISILVIICERAETDVRVMLDPAIQAGLVSYAWGVIYFLHDRVQEAAYRLIPETRRPETHLRIGRFLASGLDDAARDERIFDVVSHLNRGADLIQEQSEKALLFRMNCLAARKARNAIAYTAAQTYFAQAAALMPADAFDTQYEVAFTINLELAECEYLAGDFSHADMRLNLLGERAGCRLDRARALALRSRLYQVSGRHNDAAMTMDEAFRQFGIVFPETDTEASAAFMNELQQVPANMNGRRIEDLLDAPDVTDANERMVISLLTEAMPVWYGVRSRLFPLLTLKALNYVLKHGNTPEACRVYQAYAIVLAGGLREFQAALAVSEMSMRLNEKYQDKKLRGLVLKVHGAYINHWCKPLSTSAPYLEQAFSACMGVGDLPFAGYAAVFILMHALQTGEPLDATLGICQRYVRFATDIHNGVVAILLRSHEQFVLGMQGKTQDLGSFNDDSFSETECETTMTQANWGSGLAVFLTAKQMSLAIAGQHGQSLEYAKRVEQLLPEMTAMFIEVSHHFYHALSLAALCADAPSEQRAAYVAALDEKSGKLKFWADKCPENFLAFYTLVCAEQARLEGRDIEAMRAYEAAIRSARDGGFRHVEAIGNELAAQFYLVRGVEKVADIYLHETCSCYERWGATGKVRQLRTSYPQLTETPSASAVHLDVLSTVKASQAISGQIVLESLLDTLMRNVLESAGAQHCFLLLAEDEKLSLAAEARVEQDGVRVEVYKDTDTECPSLPESVLNYVRRSHEQVLLANASEPNAFSKDRYFLTRQVKSVLCLPIVRQAGVVALLYMENNLVTHAFLPQRVAVLQLLASQAAISLDNARLFANLKQEIHERKRVEEALRDREARIRRLVESNIIGIMFADMDGHITDANDAFLDMLGYTREELSAGMLSWIKLTPKKNYGLADRALADMRTIGRCVPFETEYLRKDGSLVPVMVGATLFEDSQKNGVAFVLDLSERKQAEAERQARLASEAANQAKGEFLAGISHELRSPLNVILGFSRLLEQQADLTVETREDLGVVLRSGEHLFALINQVLDMSKVEAGRMLLNEGRVDLNQLLTELEGMFAFKMKDKGLTFSVIHAPEILPAISTDLVKLRQILINLLSNSLKFTQSGNVKLRMTFHAADETHGKLNCAVEDTGLGISAEEIPKLFGAFVQAKAGRESCEGTGLGLSLSRGFVKLMGGEMHVLSELGAGSVFSFDLPVTVLAPKEADLEAAADADVIGLAPGEREYRILVVDDLKEARQLLIRLLTPLGFAVSEASNGQECVALWREWRPDLILMDMNMPVMSGHEATRLIRELAQGGPGPVIVALTASSFENEQSEIWADGCDAFLSKPLHDAALFGVLRQHLGVRFKYREPAEVVPTLPSLNAAALSALPSYNITALRNAITHLDSVALAAAINDVLQYDEAVGQSLATMANDFQYDRIWRLLQELPMHDVADV